MSQYEPPITLTSATVNLVASISELVGQWLGEESRGVSPRLRRENRIQTIQASLEIENNTLNIEQVTAVIAGKHVKGIPREIQEVKNAFAAYEALDQWDPSDLKDFLAAHAILMKGLVENPGKVRTKGVGIYRGESLVHMAPQAKRVNALLDDLFAWLSKSDLHPLIASCVVHYELEFIHPFSDGNGRMGRLSQSLILSRWHPSLAYLPVETFIRDHQGEYYQALADSDHAGEATPFVEFMLHKLKTAVANAIQGSEQSSEVGSEESSEQLLALLRLNPAQTALQLSERLGISPRAVEKRLAKLRLVGRIRRVGPNRGGHWELLD